MRLGNLSSQSANARAQQVRCSGLHLLEKMPAFSRKRVEFVDTLKYPPSKRWVFIRVKSITAGQMAFVPFSNHWAKICGKGGSSYACAAFRKTFQSLSPRLPGSALLHSTNLSCMGSHHLIPSNFAKCAAVLHRNDPFMCASPGLSQYDQKAHHRFYTLSQNCIRINAACARVALPDGDSVVVLVPPIIPSALAQAMASTAKLLIWLRSV